MQRPNELELTVPFIFLQIPCAPTSGNAAFTPKAGKDTAVKTSDSAATFQISVDPLKELQSVSLVVGVHRDGGLQQDLNVEVNGRQLAISTAWAKDCNSVFAPLTVNVPNDWLTQVNKIVVAAIKGMTVTSVHLSTHQQ